MGRLFNFLGKFHWNAMVGRDCRRLLLSENIRNSCVGIPCYSPSVQREGVQTGHKDAGDPATVE